MSTALGTAQDLPVGPGPHPGHMLAMSALGVFLEMLSPSQSGQLLLCLQPLACHFKEEPSPNLGRGVKMFCESTAGFHDAMSSSLHSPAFSTAVADSSPGFLFASCWPVFLSLGRSGCSSWGLGTANECQPPVLQRDESEVCLLSSSDLIKIEPQLPTAITSSVCYWL